MDNMMPLRLVGLLGSLACCSLGVSTTIQTDIVVTGGSFGAPAAALAAARANPTAQVLLVEPTDWLGGQSTSQGVSAIDNAHHAPAGALMANHRSTYYPADYLQFIEAMKNLPVGAPGTGMGPNGTSWVSRESFDPRSGAWVLDQMMAAQPNITVLKMTVVKSVETAPVNDAFGVASNITSLSLIQRTPKAGYTPFTKFLSEELPDWYSYAASSDFDKESHGVVAANLAKGLVVIDASETGDAIVLSGAQYVVGREQATEVVAENGTLPAHNESQSQATVFPFCMTSRTTPDAETNLQAPWADFATYYNTQATSHFGFGTWNWPMVWSYRRLFANGPVPANTVQYQGDVSMQNWNPGNDYPYASIYMTKAQAAAQAADWQGGLHTNHLSGAEKHALSWYFYMKNHRTSSFDTKYLNGSDPANMMDTPHGLAKFPYIRCGRRIVGLQNYRLLQRYFRATNDIVSSTSYRFHDSVGIGNYASDVHAVSGSSGVGPTISLPAPFYIPYRALGSGNVRNLLAGAKNFAATYASNSAYRLHPIEWAIGSAAGSAAGLMNRDGKSNIDLSEPVALKELQDVVRANSPIWWAAYDGQSTASQNGDLVINELKTISAGGAFTAEVYHHNAVHARIYKEGNFLGESTTRANGRLVFTNLVTGGSGVTNFTAECYGPSNNLLATLSSKALIMGLPVAGGIVDDADPATTFTLSGSWTHATAQANKYATSYKYAQGNGNVNSFTRSATWQLPIYAAGHYDVFVWYPESSNRAIDAPFTVHYKGGTLSSLKRINQRQTGGQWVKLGTYEFSGNNTGERVVLTNATAGNTLQDLVLADAVGVVFNAPVPVTISAVEFE